MGKKNKKIVYCKYCGLELENGVCACGADFNNEKSINVKKIKCDTCKKVINADSKFCPYCGVPVGTEVYSESLKKELRGDFEIDVLADLKKGGQKTEANGEIFTPGLKRFIAILVSILLLLFVIKGISLIKNNIKQQEVQKQQEELASNASETSNNVEQSKTYYNAREDEQALIPIRENWKRQDGYFYCVDKEGNPVIDDWVAEKDEEGNTVYYYFDIDGRLVVNSWIDGEYYVGEDGTMYVNRKTPDGATVDKDGKVIINDASKAIQSDTQETRVYYEFPDVDSVQKPSNQNSSSSGVLKGIEEGKEYELYIQSIKKIKDSYESDDDKCNITYYYPIIVGNNEKEVNKVNELVEEMFSNRFNNVLRNMKDEQNKVPKTIVLNVVDQKQVNSHNFIFIVSGKVVPRSTGITENKKYRFVYDRNAKELYLLDISDS